MPVEWGSMSGQENIWLLVILLLAIDLYGLTKLRVNVSLTLLPWEQKFVQRNSGLKNHDFSVYFKYMYML